MYELKYCKSFSRIRIYICFIFFRICSIRAHRREPVPYRENPERERHLGAKVWTKAKGTQRDWATAESGECWTREEIVLVVGELHSSWARQEVNGGWVSGENPRVWSSDPEPWFKCRWGLLLWQCSSRINHAAENNNARTRAPTLRPSVYLWQG